jgi:hypothetical protein
MAKNGNDDDRDDSLIDSLLARLVMKVINETKALYLVRAQDILSHVHDIIASKEHWLGKCY